MIIQKVIKGITGAIRNVAAREILSTGILCKWRQLVPQTSEQQVQDRLTEDNLHWHQNRYDSEYPGPGGRPFCETTPFISTTAGTVVPDALYRRNLLYPPWWTALYFATEYGARDDGYLYYCYLFVLGKRSVKHRGFSEELRELNVYTHYSQYHPEGEITAKIIIPSVQIERLEHWSIDKILDDLDHGREPEPVEPPVDNDLYERPEDICNIRELISYKS